MRKSLALGVIGVLMCGCNAAGIAAGGASVSPAQASGGVGPITGVSPSPAPAPAPPGAQGSSTGPALVFNGDGAWHYEAQQLESVMANHQIKYDELDSSHFNALTASEYAQYKLIVFPGGSGTQMLNSLNDSTRTLIMNAVLEQGAHYLGFCAGAFLAVSPAPGAGQAPEFFSLIQSPVEDTYNLSSDQMISISFADGSTRSILWAGGPVTPTISGGVVGKYSTGEPAVTEATTGAGFTLISGVHPAANTENLDIAWEFLQAALNGSRLPAFGG